MRKAESSARGCEQAGEVQCVRVAMRAHGYAATDVHHVPCAYPPAQDEPEKE